MGTFFVNFHAKTKSSKAVTTTLRKLINTRAYVTSARGGWVSVYEERTSSQDTDEIIRLARELSLHLDKPVIALCCHDSDVFCYWLFDGGQLAPVMGTYDNGFASPVTATGCAYCHWLRGRRPWGRGTTPLLLDLPRRRSPPPQRAA